MRINKYIAQSGLCSRRKADQLIESGLVNVNNETVHDFSLQVSDDDYVVVDGTPIRQEKSYEYLLLRKPKEVISAVSDDRGRTTVLDLVQAVNRIFPVGRLDYNTSGVLLLTNDGDLCNKLTHPSFEVDKTYHVRVSRLLTNEELNQLRKGITIEGRKTSPCIVTVIKKADKTMDLEMTIHEGRNRQIRKMIESLGAAYVRKLDRISYAGLAYKGLETGEFRSLNKKEIEFLKSL